MSAVIVDSFIDEMEKISDASRLLPPAVAEGLSKSEAYAIQDVMRTGGDKYQALAALRDARLARDIARATPTSQMAELIRAGSVGSEMPETAFRGKSGRLVYPLQRETRLLEPLSEAEAYARSRSKMGGPFGRLRELLSNRQSFKRFIRSLVRK
jgi:hypothetical protein